MGSLWCRNHFLLSFFCAFCLLVCFFVVLWCWSCRVFCLFAGCCGSCSWLVSCGALLLLLPFVARSWAACPLPCSPRSRSFARLAALSGATRKKQARSAAPSLAQHSQNQPHPRRRQIGPVSAWLLSSKQQVSGLQKKKLVSRSVVCRDIGRLCGLGSAARVV